MSVTGELHVLSTEGSLSLSVAGPVSLGGEEAHVHVRFLGGVASALRFLGLRSGLGSNSISVVIVPQPALFARHTRPLNVTFMSLSATIPAAPALVASTISIDEELASPSFGLVGAFSYGPVSSDESVL